MSILEWSAILPRVELATAAEFDHAMDTLSARSSSGHPTIVALYAHGHHVIIGVGLDESFVQIQHQDDPENKPALVTVGQPKASGAVSFYLLGAQHTEIPRRNLIPATTARRLARQFLTNGKVSEEATWEPA